MKKAIGLALVLGVTAISMSASATEARKPPPAPQAAEPTGATFKPYAHPGDGDNDGLSRDPDDCNKGCIGGNPG